MLRKKRLQNTGLVLLFTLLAFLVMGYHPGFEDDGIYLTSVKADLNPALYPHNADFFRLQTQATVFDNWMAFFVHWTGMPLAWSELAWQLVSLFLILWAAERIAAQLFEEVRARWAAVAMVAAMFTLPVAGTALNLADQHLHPRNLATALILVAITRILEGKSWDEGRWQALPLLVIALVLHPIMAVLGMSFCGFLAMALMEPVPFLARATEGSLAAAAAPLAWIFAPASDSWREALSTRTYYSLYRWTWYEWLGALGPLVLFWALWRVAERRGEERLARFALAVLAFGVFYQAVAMAILGPDALVRLSPLQPMRYLHLVYLFMALVGGGLLGRLVLRRSAWRWAVYLVVINGSMFWVQRVFIDQGAHLELPDMATANPWIQAFDWARGHTPVSAYFALEPRYLAEPGEGFHSFRAIAERSQLADGIKDTAVVMQVPSLGPVWHQQELAEAGWEHFAPADFARLKGQFGVDWVVVRYPQPLGLDCRWHNGQLAVCRVP